MTSNEFLKWLEKCSVDPLHKNSLGEQVRLIRAEIMDANAELFRTAIENLVERNSNPSTLAAVSVVPQDQLTATGTAHAAWLGELSRANGQCTQTAHRHFEVAKPTS